MSVKIDKQENSKVVMEFTMTKEEFNKNLDKAFVKHAKYFKVPGFRNGKVPRAVVEKTYGEGILYDAVIEDIADEAYKTAVEENKLEIVSKPELDIKQIGKDKDLIYTITVYVKPEATVKKYKGLEIEKFDTTVTDEDIEHELFHIREKNARTVTVEDRALQENDISTIDFEGFVDGVAFEGGKGENFELTIGSGQFIPGFEEQLVGMTIGEEREINVKFPEEYHAENLCGKDAMFKVKLISIKAKDLPELDDEFAKDVSEFETLEDYKKDIRVKLEAQKESQAKSDKELKAIEKLVENTEVNMPEAMIEKQVEEMLEQFSANLSYQGLDIKTYCNYMGTTVEGFKETLRPQAQKDVKLKLALEYIAKTENVTVDDKAIDEKIEELVAQYGNDNAESLKKNENVRHYMTEKLLQENTLNIVLDNVVIK